VECLNVVEGVGLLSAVRPALVIGHPGHELRVYGWLSAVRPQVSVLTDGSGRSGLGRLGSTVTVLEQAGIRATLSAAFSDAEIYDAILGSDILRFTAVTDELAKSFADEGVDSVVSDASEGFNPTHDLCREITRAAAVKAQRMTGRDIPHYEFCLTEWHNSRQELHDSRCVHVRCDDATLALKIKLSCAYPELRDEVDHALAAAGPEYFRIECLKRVDRWAELDAADKPQYESWGEQRVAEGRYSSVILFRQHMVPILKALRDHALQAPLEEVMVERAPQPIRRSASPR